MKSPNWIVALIAAAAFGPAARGADLTNAAPAITVASYYFGQYHPNDPRNEKTKGKGWTEWELVKAAKPRFPGHQQPKVPLWGYRGRIRSAGHGPEDRRRRRPRH